MFRQTVLFEGLDPSGNAGLWETNGTAAGTYQLTGISDAYSNGFLPAFHSPFLTVFNGELLFEGYDASGNGGLWITSGTAAGTHEVTGVSGAYAGSGGWGPVNLVAFNGEVLFDAYDTNEVPRLWVTNGTAAGTSEVGGLGNSGINGASMFGLNPQYTTVGGGVVFFIGYDNSNHWGLWVTNGVASGTHEVTGISGANSGGIGILPADLLAFGPTDVLFNGTDASGYPGLWVTDGVGAHTHELTGINDGYASGIFNFGTYPDFTVFNSEVLFDGLNASGYPALWMTNASTATELTGIHGVYSGGIFNGGLDPFFTVLKGEVLFEGINAQESYGLWVTNGTAAGTSELTGISGVFTGSFGFEPQNMMVFNGEVLFEGRDASGIYGMWVTNGTAAGTSELTGINGVRPNGIDPDSFAPATFTVPPPDDFQNNNTSDILFQNDTSGDTWFEAITNGAFKSWNQIGGSDTTYSVVGMGDFYGTGKSDILYRNNSTGDTWFESISNGAFGGWTQIGGSDTTYAIAGLGDFTGYGTSDILFRDTSTGDTWFEAISNGAFNGWNQIGGSDTHYSVVGIGDFFESGVDDILFRNNSTGDTWVEQITNGASAGWYQIGGSDTTYSVVGVGDFFGNGTDDILFRNSSSGDTWFEAISNGAFNGWHQIGGSDTTYSVAGIGDYFGNNTSDILFRNSAGDTWVEQITNGAFAGWNQIGGSSTSYSVPVTVGPPALT